MKTFTSRLVRFLRGMMSRYMPGMISCVAFDQFIDDYLAKELTPKETWIFELHLKMCADCRAYLADYEKTVALNKASLAEKNTENIGEIPDALIQAILKAKQHKKPDEKNLN